VRSPFFNSCLFGPFACYYCLYRSSAWFCCCCCCYPYRSLAWFCCCYCYCLCRSLALFYYCCYCCCPYRSLACSYSSCLCIPRPILTRNITSSYLGARFIRVRLISVAKVRFPKVFTFSFFFNYRPKILR